MNMIISFIFGLIPMMQFIIKGWYYFGISLVLFVVYYFLIRNKGSKNILIFTVMILLCQFFSTFFIGSNFLIMIYTVVVAILFYIQITDEKKLENLKKELQNRKINSGKWNFFGTFFAQGRIETLENLKDMKQTFLGIGKEGIIFSLKMPTGEITRYIKAKEIKNFGMFRLEGDQEIYYSKISDMFLPSKRLRTLHKPTLETYGVYIELSDEVLSFYEEAKTIKEVTDKLEESL